jgi:hypothetical protein
MIGIKKYQLARAHEWGGARDKTPFHFSNLFDLCDRMKRAAIGKLVYSFGGTTRLDTVTYRSPDDRG